MKKRLLFIGGVVLVAALIVMVWLFFQLGGELLSADQLEARELLGAPEQFVITYLPRGGEAETEMVRSEVWYYPTVGKQLTFLAGELLATDPYQAEIKATPTSLLPEQFDVLMDYDEVESVLGTQAIVPVSDLPVFSSDNLQTYLSDQVLFIIEDGYVTYIQTLSTDNQELADLKPTVTKLPSQNTIRSNLFGFTITLQPGWYLGADDIVLTNYDITSITDPLNLPEEMVKCDLIPDPPVTTAALSNVQLVDTTSEKVINRYTIEEQADDTPGFGDGIVYQLQTANQSELWLVCFALHPNKQAALEQILGTITYD